MEITRLVVWVAGVIVMVSSSGGVIQAQETAAKDGSAKQQSGRSGTMEPGTDKPYFQMSAEERKLFAAKVQTLKIGDSRQSVESLLGKPWSDHRAAAKETRRFLGRFVTYYLTMRSKETANDNDEGVTFRFDANDCLVKISSHAADIPSRP